MTLVEDTAGAAREPSFNASEIMQAVASTPAVHRDLVIAVDILGMSYRELARTLCARQATVTPGLHRGRQHVARALIARQHEPRIGGGVRLHGHTVPGASERSEELARLAYET